MGLSWMPVTRSRWPCSTCTHSSVAVLYTLTKSPDTQRRYLQREKDEPTLSGESDLFAVRVPFKQWFTAEATGLLMVVEAGTLVGLFSQQTDPQATERSFHLVWEVRAYIDVYLPYGPQTLQGRGIICFPMSNPVCSTELA